MALPGFYKVNFTDPRKEGFIIEPYQTNGMISPVSNILDDKAAHAHTSLLLYGRDVPNYGERVAENFVQLLENFAGPAAPSNPIEGQLWFDTGTIYTVSAWSSATTLYFIGDLASVFNAWAASSTPIQLCFKPANSVTDNTFQQVTLLVDSAASAGVGATSVVFKSTTGDAVSIPPTVVGGFVTSAAPGYSRMRVATKVGADIKWVDITNVLSSTDAPEATHLTVGDLWYDSATQQLKVYGTGGWASVAAKYLPLTGGTMTGVIQMGANKIFSSGTITAVAGDLNALVNRKYVDGVQADLQSQIDDLEADIGNVGGAELDKKVNRVGDQMTGPLIFGDGTATTTLTGPGIDAGNKPIIRPLITWSATDYKTATTQTNYVVDKNYVAKAFAQHLLDEKHGAGGFIQIQPDGTGVFPEDVAFQSAGAGKSYKFSWYDPTGNNSHQMYAQFSGSTSQLVLEAGTDSADTIDFRHSLQGVDPNPLYRVGFNGMRSFKTLYLHDGQPQPTMLGAPTAMNDDTAAASKGFVRQYVEDNKPEDTGNTGPGSVVTTGSYAYNVEAKTYTLTLLQSESSPIVVNEYHKHDPYDIDYLTQTVQDFPWSEEDPLIDLLEEAYPTFPNITVGDMLRLLNVYKAPIQGAVFNDSPKVGISAPVVSYDSASKTINVEGGYAGYDVVGMPLIITPPAGNQGIYTIVSVAAGTPNVDGETTNFVVAETITFNGVEGADGVRAEVGARVLPTNTRGLVTRGQLDAEVTKSSQVDYLYYKAASAGTNVVKALGFTYTPAKNKLWVFRNGQKLRVNTLTGGDYNETSATSITIANVYAGDEFEIYEI
ncbi:hypothetical protein D3C75_465550 [compost metagenome]